MSAYGTFCYLRMTLQKLWQLVFDLRVRVFRQNAHLDLLLAVVVAQQLEHVVAHVDAGGLVDPTQVMNMSPELKY